jgi:hypothetical protein
MLGQSTVQIIRVSNPAGAHEFTLDAIWTAPKNQDITGATFEMSLGTRDEPAAWVPASMNNAGDGPNQRVLNLLVDASTPPGTYWLWVRLTDTPEVVPRKGHMIRVI